MYERRCEQLVESTRPVHEAFVCGPASANVCLSAANQRQRNHTSSDGEGKRSSASVPRIQVCPHSRQYPKQTASRVRLKQRINEEWNRQKPEEPQKDRG